MEAPKRLALPVVFIILLIGSVVSAIAGVPEVDNTMITDVTTVSFSVIWSANESANANLEVFDEEGGLTPTSSVIITPHPVSAGNESIKTAAEDNGVMKVRVTGLVPGKTYYFKTVTTSKSTSDVTLYPASAPFTAVTTEVKTVRANNDIPFSNDIIIEPCYLADRVTPAEGTLLLATMEGADYPLTSFVGDGVELPNAIIDLNNAFSRDSKENLDLIKGKNLTLLNFRGFLGNSIVTHNVPDDNSLSEVKLPDNRLEIGANFVSFQLEPDNSSTLTILDDIIDDVRGIWAYDNQQEKWIYYDKLAPPFLNRLLDLQSKTGYWLVMENNASLKIEGGFSNAPIQLYTGANLVGYRSVETLKLMDAVGPIFDKLESIWTYDPIQEKWIFYDKNAPPFLNRLEYIEPGRAYWVVVNDNCEW